MSAPPVCASFIWVCNAGYSFPFPSTLRVGNFVIKIDSFLVQWQIDLVGPDQLAKLVCLFVAGGAQGKRGAVLSTPPF
jgi:hypothetical protein